MVNNINRDQLSALIEEGAQLVDVLPEREYEAQHIAGAVNIPLKQITVETVTVLRHDKPVVVY